MQWQFHCFSLILNEESNNICLPIFSLFKYFKKFQNIIKLWNSRSSYAVIEASKHFFSTVSADKPSG